ncbi:hypothetical protein B0H14DRAFT_3160700 [Mycena olivaceomarginata]|nr:hypothetical protein B0H14DRAFT_3160700 [Mycena olivaceomarginata]
MSPTSKGVSQPLESPGFILPRFVITLPQFGNGVVSTTVSDPRRPRFADPSLPTPQTGSPTSTVALPTYDHPSPHWGPSHRQHCRTPHLPTLTLSSAPVSSTLKAYDPVSTVTFSQLQASFSTIGVSSNILTAEGISYGAYVVMFGFTLYNRLESRSIGNSETLFNQTFKDYSSVAIATNAVYVTSKYTLLRNLEFSTKNHHLPHTSDPRCRGPHTSVHATDFAIIAGRIWWDRTNSSDAIGTNGDQQIPHRMCHDLGVGCHLLRQRNCVRRYRVYVGSSILDHGTHTGTVGGNCTHDYCGPRWPGP